MCGGRDAEASPKFGVSGFFWISKKCVAEGTRKLGGSVAEANQKTHGARRDGGSLA